MGDGGAAGGCRRQGEDQVRVQVRVLGLGLGADGGEQRGASPLGHRRTE